MAVKQTIPTGTDPTGLSDDDLVEFIRVVSERRKIAEAQVESTYSAVVAAFREARRRQPPVLQRKLAEAAGISEGAVIAAIALAEKREAKAAAAV